MDIVFTHDKKDITLTGTPSLFEPVHKSLYLSPIRAAKPSAQYRQAFAGRTHKVWLLGLNTITMAKLMDTYGLFPLIFDYVNPSILLWK